ncbi:MAG: hypothetical protein RL748_2813 [Pseudomonadota bacterium]
MREREANKIYLRELFGSLLLYAAILIPAQMFGPDMPVGLARAAVLMSPMLGMLLVLWAVVRQFNRVDEYIRLYILENVTLGAAITAAWTFSYGFLENVGFPKLSMFVIWGSLFGLWGLITCIRGWVSR